MNPFLKENISVSRKPESFRNTKAIILVDTLNNTAIHYETVKLMLQDLGLKSTGATSIVKRYLYPTKLYKQQYEFIMLRNIKILLVFEKNLNFYAIKPNFYFSRKTWYILRLVIGRNHSKPMVINHQNVGNTLKKS